MVTYRVIPRHYDDRMHSDQPITFLEYRDNAFTSNTQDLFFLLFPLIFKAFMTPLKA